MDQELKEVFGEPISVYTDADALRDGALVDVRGIAPRPINRVTRALWTEYTQPMGKLGRRSPVTNITPLAELLRTVRARMDAGQLEEGWVALEDKGRKIWGMANDAGGWTAMFAEDY